MIYNLITSEDFTSFVDYLLEYFNDEIQKYPIKINTFSISYNKPCFNNLKVPFLQKIHYNEGYGKISYCFIGDRFYICFNDDDDEPCNFLFFIKNGVHPMEGGNL